MATTVTNTIGSGQTYTTLQSWEDAKPANLVTSDQIWQGVIQASTDSFSASSPLAIAGSTSDSTRYTELTVATGASFADNASVQSNALRYNASNGCAITGTSNYGVAIDYAEYFKCSKLQVQGTGGQTKALGNNSGTGTILDVDRCIFEGKSPGGSNADGSAVVRGGTFRNSLVVTRVSSANRIAEFNADATVVNCTFAVPSDLTAATNGLRIRYGTYVVKNCAVFGATADASVAGTMNATTCYTSDASPSTGFTTATYNTSQFTNISNGTHDYRLLTGSALLDVGTTDSTNAATDIAGTSRPQSSAYDVGCWELVVGGGGGGNPWYYYAQQ
jgi:hypothetical protein